MSRLSPQDRNTLDNYTGMTVGQIFRRARTDHGYALVDIAEHLNIVTTHLEAIEGDDIKSLPPKVYAVGFVRAYADVLGLDSEKMSYLFKVQFYGRTHAEQQNQMIRPEGKVVSLQETFSQKEYVLPAILATAVLAFFVLLALVFFVVWLLTPTDRGGRITVPAVPAELVPPTEQNDSETVDELAAEIMDDTVIPLEEDAEAVAVDVMPEEAIEIAVTPDDGGTAYGADPLEAALALKMIDDSWLQIMDLNSGKALLTRTLKKGDVFYSTETQDILVTTGNAGGVEVYLDGKSLGVMGNAAQVVRARPLSVKALRLQKGE